MWFDIKPGPTMNFEYPFFLVFGDCLIETNLLNKNQADVFEFNNFIASVEVSVLVSPINNRVFFYITIYNYFWWFIEVKRTRNPLFDTVWITHAENSNVTMKNDTGSDDMVPNEVFHHANHKLKANVIIINIITEMSKYFFSINSSSFKLPFLFIWNNIYLNKSEHDEKHKYIYDNTCTSNIIFGNIQNIEYKLAICFYNQFQNQFILHVFTSLFWYKW